MIIGPGEHSFVDGRTGSGKTYLVRKYLMDEPRVIVLDTKRTLDWPEVDAVIIESLTELTYQNISSTPKIIYRPPWHEMDMNFYNAFFEWCFKQPLTLRVWVDELMSICPNPTRYPLWWRAIMTQGREKGITAFNLTQRPKGIPLLAISEATHIFSFDLNTVDDRQRLVETTGAPEFKNNPGLYKFWYYNMALGTGHATKARLVERKGGVEHRRG